MFCLFGVFFTCHSNPTSTLSSVTFPTEREVMLNVGSWSTGWLRAKLSFPFLACLFFTWTYFVMEFIKIFGLVWGFFPESSFSVSDIL